MTHIVQKPDPVLRKTAKLVKKSEIKSEQIQQIIANMKKALHETDDGVAIAAPQIGESLRIFLVRDSVFEERGDIRNEDKVFINPEITNTSSEKVEMSEGCLSVKDHFGTTTRAKQATVKALDETAEAFELGGSGLLAQIFQHETDHLDGILFDDHARDVKNIKNVKSGRVNKESNEK